MRIAFRKRIGSVANIFIQPAASGAEPERVLASPSNQLPVAWTPDGHAFVFMVTESPGDSDVWTVSLAGDRVAIPIVKKPGMQLGGQISPDGRWLAYTSDESGQFEIYVTRFPGGGGAVPVSSGGGTQAVWARNGRELFYRSGTRVMAVAVEAGDEFKAGKPAVLFDGKYLRGTAGAASFDVSADGSRFVMISTAAEDAAVRHVNVGARVNGP
jgi:eukaryotic-like serine/threonine-protein kinase